MACLAAEPVVNRLKTEFIEQLDVLQVDIATPAGREIAAQFSAFATPTFIFFDPDGNEAWRAIGSLDPDQVRAALP